jgi:pyridinium-3,5-bisthiocarboxylic acid mononucleotide nickel chelatase
MKIAYFDCIAGASGDMILGALVDAGLALSDLETRLAALHLPDFRLAARKVAKNAFAATKVDVIVSDDVPERHLGDILDIVEASDLAPGIKEKAIAIFRKIGSAEAAIHGTSLDAVHLHELGGVDTIVDVVGALVGLEALGIEHVVVSPVPLGRGFIRGAHGRIPLPAPATVALLKGVPVVGSPLEVETVTPTGAALLASLGDAFGPIPGMMLETVGYGAGSRDMPVPNVLRLLIGQSTASQGTALIAGNPTHSHGHIHPHTHESDSPPGRSRAHTHESGSHPGHSHAHTHGDAGHTHPHSGGEAEHDSPEQLHEHFDAEGEAHGHAYGEHTHRHDAQGSEGELHTHTPSCLDTATLKVLETNIDDLNPETYEYVMDALFAAGALDVYFAPIQMKKNRPATLLRVLCKPDDVEPLVRILFVETSTLGVREQTVDRHALTRSIEHVETPYGSVHVKIADLGEGKVKSAPEYEDCRRLARASGVPLREVYQTAQEASRRQFGG